MQVVHEANAENLRLKEMLLMRENRISELETEVDALNKVIAQLVLTTDHMSFTRIRLTAQK